MKDFALLVVFVWAVGATIGWFKSEERWLAGQVPASEVRVLATQVSAAGRWAIQEGMFRGYLACERELLGAERSSERSWKRRHFGDSALLEMPEPVDFNRVLRQSRPDPALPAVSAPP